jgi:hypothetical protein
MTPLGMSCHTHTIFAELPLEARREFSDWLLRHLAIIEGIHNQEDNDSRSKAISRARARWGNNTIDHIRKELAEILYPSVSFEDEHAEVMKEG